MATGRALATESERDYLAGTEGQQRASEAKSRIGKRIEEILKDDMEHFEEHAPVLLEKLQAVVCENGATEPSDPDEKLKALSQELGLPITVGQTVYESGDKHPLSETEEAGAEGEGADDE